MFFESIDCSLLIDGCLISISVAHAIGSHASAALVHPFGFIIPPLLSLKKKIWFLHSPNNALIFCLLHHKS